MNPDNPYAAPQTSLQTMPNDAESAELGERRLFPDLDTVSLRLLAARSGLIADMTWVWLLLLIVGAPTFLFAIAFLDSPNAEHLVIALSLEAVLALSVLRFALGFFRAKPLRIFFLIMDGLLAACSAIGCLVFLYRMVSGPHFALLFALAMCGLFSVIFWRSCRALFLAPELFESGRFPHKLLMQEVKYRQEYGIE